MTADELFTLFRSDVADATAYPLWSDAEVWNYMNDAYRMFVRNIGGIPDISSDATAIPLVAGKATSEVSPLILKFRSAYLESDGRMLTIINESQEPTVTKTDYWGARVGYHDRTLGTVNYMVTGGQRDLVRWVRVPKVNDVCRLSILRLPLDTIERRSDLAEVAPEHHEALLLWMKARAYGKQDAETFDRGRRDQYQMQFEAYCYKARAEWDQYRSHTGPVAYGGI